MLNYSNTLLYKLPFLFVCLVLAASLFVLMFALVDLDAKGSSDEASANISANPNIVTNGMMQAADDLAQATSSMAGTLESSVQFAVSAVGRGGALAARATLTGVTTVARGVGGGLAFMGRAIGGGIGFVASVPGDVLGFISDTSVVRAVIRPADHEPVPIIDPQSPALADALAALPPAKVAAPATPQGNPGPAWPMHGEVTTEFGVDHWPFQHTHTGIDISDGQPSGVTPIKPFRPGRVIDVVHSSRGLGNHVIVDHGNGVTSVYAHLASISASEGQEVGMDTVLGFEGTTGVSTGTHLHFEIRVHGQAADPRQFIGGQP